MTFDENSLLNLGLDITYSPYELPLTSGSFYIPLLVRINLGNFHDWYNSDGTTTAHYTYAHSLEHQAYADWIVHNLGMLYLQLANSDISLNINNKKNCSTVLMNQTTKLHIVVFDHTAQFELGKWIDLKINSTCWDAKEWNQIDYQITIDQLLAHNFRISQKSYGHILLSNTKFITTQQHTIQNNGLVRYTNYDLQQQLFNQCKSLYSANLLIQPGEIKNYQLKDLYYLTLQFTTDSQALSEYELALIQGKISAVHSLIYKQFYDLKITGSIISSATHFSFKNLDAILKFNAQTDNFTAQLVTASKFDTQKNQSVLSDGTGGIALDWHFTHEDLQIANTIGLFNSFVTNYHYQPDQPWDLNKLLVNEGTRSTIDDVVTQAPVRFKLVRELIMKYFNQEWTEDLYKEYCDEFEMT